MTLFEITGYTKTGFYAEVVEAENSKDALNQGKKLIKILAGNGFKKIFRWSVTLFAV